MYEIKVNCRFCGKNVSTMQLPNIFPTVNPVTGEETYPNITPENLGVEDARCSECEAEKGNFKEMLAVAEVDLGLTPQQSRSIIARAEGDVSKFTEMAVMEHPEKSLTKQLRGTVEEKKNAFVETIGLESKDPEVQFQSVKRVVEKNGRVSVNELKNGIALVVADVEEEVTAKRRAVEYPDPDWQEGQVGKTQ